MAQSPSIGVRVLADLTQFAKSVSGAADTGASAFGKMRAGFSDMLGAINQTGVLGPFADVLDGIGKGIDGLISKGKSVPGAMVGLGTAVAGIGVGLSALGSKDQAAHQQLQAAVQATGKDYDDYADKVEGAIKKQEKYGDTAGTTQDALRVLTQALGDPQKALDALGTATDLAAAKHESLDTAATQLGKAYNGNQKILKEFGISMESASKANDDLGKAQDNAAKAADAQQKAHQKLADVQAELAGKSHLTVAEQIRLRDAQDGVAKADANAEDANHTLAAAQDFAKKAASEHGSAIGQLADKLRGQGNAAADTFGGKIKALKAHFEDSAAALGQKYGPALTGAGAGMALLGGAMKTAQGIGNALKDSELAQAAATKIATAAQWLWNAAMDANPMVLLAIAIAAVVAVIVIILVKTGILKEAWKDMQKAAEAVWHAILDAIHWVWDFITQHWDLLLPILLGPFGILVDLVIKNFDTIKRLVMDVVHFIAVVWNGIVDAALFVANMVVGAWNWLYGVLRGIAAAIVGGFQWAWNLVVAGVQWVVSVAMGIWNAFYAGVAFVFGLIGSVASGVWNGIVGAIRFAKDLALGIWNDFYNGVTGWVGKFGGIFSGMWDGIKNALNSAIGGVKSLWNNTIGGFGFTLPSWIPGVGGQGFHIPSMATGGIVTGPTLALIGEAGPEAVVPLNGRGGGLGPAVNIEAVYLTEGADVDMLVQRLAFAATAGRL